MLFLRPRRERYRSFGELLKREREGVDFERAIALRGSRVAVVAPHGGGIEAGTSEIARAVAGRELSLYTFDGIKPRGNEILHVTSNLFDDSPCLEIVRTCETVVTMHGADGKDPIVEIGGLDVPLRDELIVGLRAAGFRADRDDTKHSGLGPTNICNRGASGSGAQLEISRGLRLAMFEGLVRHERAYTTPVFRKFVGAVREVLLRRNDRPALT